MIGDGRKPFARWKAALGALVVFYAPYSWLLFVSHPWDNYRWTWFKHWLLLPGMMIDSFLLPGDLPIELIYSFSIVTTMAMITMIMFFATRSRLAALCTDAVTLLIAWAEAFIAYVAFRA